MAEYPAQAEFPYDGPDELRGPISVALRRVVDPEVSLNIVDVGLVYGVTVSDTEVHVVMTMTSVACPVTDLILEEAECELDLGLKTSRAIRIELVWEPPWSPERMSARARAIMGW